MLDNAENSRCVSKGALGRAYNSRDLRPTKWGSGVTNPERHLILTLSEKRLCHQSREIWRFDSVNP
jgi:hypothetical protein